MLRFVTFVILFFPLSFALTWNDTDQLALLSVQIVNQPDLYNSIQKEILSSWTFKQVPDLFLQQTGAEPTGNDTQFPNFGALLPWDQIFSLLGSPQRKLIFFVRHGQAWENVCSDNTLCEFLYDGQMRQNFDSGLTDLGVQQCQNLNQLMRSPSSPGSPSWFDTLNLTTAPWFASPLSRTLQTTYMSFGYLIQRPVMTYEQLRASIGYVVCDARYPLSMPTEQTILPSPFNTGCNVTAASLQSLYGNLPNITFQFPIRPPGGVKNNMGSSGFGLVSDPDSIWREDCDETDDQRVLRALAFLSQVWNLVPEQIVGVVTHSEMISAFSRATGGVPIPSANTEVVPLMIDLVQ